MSSGAAANCRVVARFRPLTAREAEAGGRCVEACAAGATQVSVSAGGDVPAAAATLQAFAFDAVLPEGASQLDVFDCVARETVDRVQQGFNGALIAYGQSGSGKTFTMGSGGAPASAVQAGLIPRITAHLLAANANDPSAVVTLTLLEVYKERIRDLLCPSRDNLQVHEGPRGTFVGDATEVRVVSETEVLYWLGEGVQNRAVGCTNLNAESSRSHLILTLQLQRASDAVGGAPRAGKLLLVDLAGSESVKKTGATGDVLDEAKSINRSLSALGNVIAALTAEDAAPGAVVPYRDSKLTRLLRECLSGAAYTTLVVCASPARRDAAETLSSLRFGARAKRLRCAPTAAVVDTPAARAAQLAALTAALAARDAELADAMAQLAALRHEPPAAAAGAGVLATTPLQSSSAARELLTVLLTWVLAVATATARDPGGLLAGL